MNKVDDIKTEIYDLLGHGVQFHVDTIMSLILAGKTTHAKERVKTLKPKLEQLQMLLEELENETKRIITIEQ